MRTPVGAAVIVLVVAACSGSDDAAAPTDGPTTLPPVVATAPESVTSETVTSTGDATDPPPDSDLPSSTDGSSASVAAPSPTFAVVDVPETGVPGLDSEDSFCAAWSRFGGSWQVIQVAANFAPDPSIVPAIEVVAAPVVDGAYDAMFAAWPDELGEEREAVADGFFGPLDRRAEAALAALDRAGVDDDDLAALESAWVDALADRQPDEPVVTPVLADELWDLVDVAAADFAGELVDFVDDPSMRITVATPLTDAYLATACPDQGALTGAEVDGG